MGQEKQLNSNVDFEKFLVRKKATNKYNDEMIDLARNDFENGITISQIDQYLQKRYNMEQMRLLSLCFGVGYPEEFIKLISGMDSEKMSKWMELYDDGFSTEQLKKFVQSGEDLETAAKNLLDGIKKVAENIPEDEPPYVVRLFEGLSEFYDKMESLVESASDDSILLELFEQIKNRDDQIKVLQDEIKQIEIKQQNVAPDDGNILKLNREISELEAIIEEQQKMIDNLMASQKQENGVKNEATNNKEVENEVNKAETTKIVKKVSSKRNSLFKLLMNMKNGKVDIVRLIINGDHTPEQIGQLRIAMDKGLTRQQIIAMINNGISADKMKAIIEIAELENKPR